MKALGWWFGGAAVGIRTVPSFLSFPACPHTQGTPKTGLRSDSRRPVLLCGRDALCASTSICRPSFRLVQRRTTHLPKLPDKFWLFDRVLNDYLAKNGVRPSTGIWSRLIYLRFLRGCNQDISANNRQGRSELGRMAICPGLPSVDGLFGCAEGPAP